MSTSTSASTSGSGISASGFSIIDAPEVRGETKTEGEAATKYLRELIHGETIIIETVKGSDGADRDDSSGRWLGTIYLDGRNINEEMIRAGHAIPYEER